MRELDGSVSRLSFAAKLADQSFSGKEQTLVAPEFGDSVFKSFGKAHDASRVDDISAVYIDLDDSPIGVEPQISGARAFDKEEGFATKEAFDKTLPLGSDVDTHR